MTRQRLKFALAVAGIVLSAVALKLKDDRVTWVAIGFLGASVLLRFLGGKPPEDDVAV